MQVFAISMQKHIILVEKEKKKNTSKGQCGSESMSKMHKEKLD